MATNNMINASPPLAKGGGTMTGDLFLSGLPTALMEAADKAYVDQVPVYNIPLISGNWYWSTLTQGDLNAATPAQYTIATGTLTFVPFLCISGGTYTDIAVAVGTTAAGTTTLGIYNDGGAGQPTGSPITNTNSGAISNSTSSLSNFTFPSPVTLTSGIYWCAFTTSATSTFYGCLNLRNMMYLGFSGIPASATINTNNLQTGWNQTFVYSSTLPAVGSLTANIGEVTATSRAALVFLKAQ